MIVTWESWWSKLIMLPLSKRARRLKTNPNRKKPRPRPQRLHPRSRLKPLHTVEVATSNEAKEEEDIRAPQGSTPTGNPLGEEGATVATEDKDHVLSTPMIWQILWHLSFNNVLI